MHQVKKFDISQLCNSSFNLLLGKRRSGKSVLCEWMIKQLHEEGMIDCAFLFSPTDAGFDCIERECRFTDIEQLKHIVDRFKTMNEYNKICKKREQIKLRVAVVLDDCAVKLKSRDFNILEELSVNGRHCAYAPLSLHFFVLSQSLTKVPRVVRLKCDCIFFNSIASSRELDLICDECLYLTDSSTQGKKDARKLYHDIVSKDFAFCVCELYQQNIHHITDFVKQVKAEI